MTENNFIISSIEDESELELMISWAKNEGWNPGIYDAKTYYETDSKGFFLGKLNGEPIGCISAVAYDLTFGFLGFYIVKPEFRNQGFGIQLWRRGLEYLGERNIGLDGVVAQQNNYRKSGFKMAYNHVRYQGIGGSNISHNLVELNSISFQELITYDMQCFPTNREKFLTNWIKQEKSIALGLVKNEQLQGYGVIRPCANGYRIGALFADNVNIADTIYQGLVADKQDCPIFIDIPSHNLLAQKLVEKYKMYPVFEAARMYNKNFPDVVINKIFAVTSLELG
ncbi:GNAT family N-acetyltransferase [Geminocystis sp. NIES-3709]|uniref:GNAT family N-acetyltransferase n=1 Tax=Geminocystis sp. NIES-3709 TaxID=1617448 RepID=UPI0005FC8617|nr:GNAT family N-acetyltransferase [Geminocystis sp. NIES-3709]BAQ63718.1 GCN5-related N-acetyltransferase [Geminocystis sp. NIES-3709]